MTSAFVGMREAAAAYHIGRSTLLNAIHNGELKAYRPGGRRLSIKITDIETWIMSKPVQKEKTA